MSDLRVMLGARARRWIVAGLVVGTGLTGDIRAQGSTPRDGLETYIRPLTICFPLNPPPLGRPVTKLAAGLRSNAPAELAAYVNEPFYAPLSTWLIGSKGLPEKLRTRLNAFRDERAALLADLRIELAPTRVVIFRRGGRR